MLDRRDTLRLLSLATLAVASSRLLAGCATETPSSGKDVTVTGTGDLQLVSSDVARTAGVPDAIPAAVASVHALGAGLYGELPADGNLALSPYSVVVALALTLNGAGGDTQAEMLSVLEAEAADPLNGGLNALTQHVESLAGTQQRLDETKAEIDLSTANALFGQQSTTWEEPFLDALAREYGAGMYDVDYRGAPEPARAAINDWTAERTQDRIEDLVPGGAITVDTRLVLVNALYLKAPWEFTFEKELTKNLPFTLADGSSVDVPTMYDATLDGLLGSGDGWQALQLRYAGQQLAMTVVLPDEGRLNDVEGAVAAGGLPEMIASVRPAEVAITLPRWTFRTSAMLKEALRAMGMELPFTDDADFSAMTTEERLFVAAVVHQVFIAVDEDGTEAAAATAVLMAETSLPQYVPFTVDRPFLFAIHDVEHGTPLFVGRVADPSAQA